MGEGETSTVGGEGPWRLGCLAAAVATAMPAATAAAGALMSVAAAGTSEEAVSTSSSAAADSAAVAVFSEEAADLANSAVVRAATARAAVLLGHLARFTVRSWSSDGGDLATLA